MICRKCGAENSAEDSTCKECGASLIKEEKTELSKEYKPLGVWTYLGYEILFALPVVGLVSLLFLVLGGTGNRNLKNFATSYLCKMIILVIIVIILFLTGVLSVANLLYL